VRKSISVKNTLSRGDKSEFVSVFRGSQIEVPLLIVKSRIAKAGDVPRGGSNRYLPEEKKKKSLIKSST